MPELPAPRRVGSAAGGRGAPAPTLAPGFLFSLFRAAPAPRRLRADDEFARHVTHLDRTPARETSRVGVVWLSTALCKRRATAASDPGAAVQAALRVELEALGATAGSERYQRFLHGLGEYRDIVAPRGDAGKERDGAPPGAWPLPCPYVGGMDPRGADGTACLVWEGAVHQVAYHVATLMPGVRDAERATDEQLRPPADRAKALIGNDHVVVTYAESPDPLDPFVVQNELNWINVLVQPLAPPLLRVSVHVRPHRPGSWTVEREKDAFPQDDAGPQVRADDLVDVKRRCQQWGYSGFAVRGGVARFRRQPRSAVVAALAAAPPSEGTTFYVAPARDTYYDEMAAEVASQGVGPVPAAGCVVHDDAIGRTVAAVALHCSFLTKAYRATSPAHGYHTNWGDRMTRIGRAAARCAARTDSSLDRDDELMGLWQGGA